MVAEGNKIVTLSQVLSLYNPDADKNLFKLSSSILLLYMTMVAHNA